MNSLFEYAKQYLSMRRNLGFKLRGYDRLLRSFIEYLDSQNHDAISAQAALQWATLPPAVKPIRWSQRLCAVRGFAQYLHGMDPTVEIPSQDLITARRYRQNPYLFTQADIARLLEVAATLDPALRAAAYQSLFGLLAVTGMRVGEALSLDREHINLSTGVVEITDTKFRKNRQIPLHSSSVSALRHYTKVRDKWCSSPNTPSFFLSTRGTRLSYSCVNGVFHRCIGQIDLENSTENRPVHMHGLRHSFAVATLREWYRSGATIEAKLPILSAFLGHACPASTYWYLQSCPQLMQLAAQRAEQLRRSPS